MWLAGHPDGAVRAALVVSGRGRLRPAGHPEPLRRRIHEQALGFAYEVGLWMLGLPWVTDDPLPHVDSPYPCFRAAAAAAGASLPAHVVHRLPHDNDSAVRTAVAFRAPHLVDAATAERIDRDYRPVKRTAGRPADWLTMGSASSPPTATSFRQADAFCPADQRRRDQSRTGGAVVVGREH